MIKVMAFVGFMCAAVTGYAGRKALYPVTVVDGHAAGSLGDARQGSGPNEHIGCETTSTATTRYAFCGAEDAKGRWGYCTSYDTPIIQGADSVSGDSYVSYEWEGRTATCTKLTVINRSDMLPKLP